MHGYKMVLNNGATLSFESKFHIDELDLVIFSDGATFVDSPDSEILIKLTEVKDAEVDGVKYQIKTYAN